LILASIDNAQFKCYAKTNFLITYFKDSIMTAENLEVPQESENTNPEESFDLNFLNYISSLGLQAMIFLGELPHPVTNKTEKNTDQAKLLIDTLSLLKEKTTGNLTDEEKNLLEGMLYELQIKYVEAVKQGRIIV